MADYSKMSDAELMALVQPKPAQDYSKMSDADLLKVVKPERGTIDMLTGRDGGERLQLWPERVARGIASSIASGATLPGDVAQGKFAVQPEKSGEWSEIDQFRQNAMEGSLGSRVMDLAAFGTPVNPAVRAGDRAIPGVAKAFKAEKPIVPTTEELAKAGGADIRAATASDLTIPSSAVAEYSRNIQRELGRPGSSIHHVDAPNTFAKLKELEGASSDAFFTPANLQSLRESLQATAQNFNPAAAKDQLAATRAIKLLDQFLPSLGAKDTMVGAAPGGIATREQLIASAMQGKREADRVSELFETGRGNYAAAMRSNDITGVLDRARTGLLERSEGRAKAAYSGRNMDNTLRQKTEAVLEKPKDISGYSDAEIAALERVVEGGSGRNAARNVGNSLGGGGGAARTLFTGAGATAGAMMGGWPGGVIGASIPTVVGSGAKAIANALAKRDLRKVDELLRKRSPLYSERVENPNMTPVSAEARAAIARAMMAGQFDQ